MRVARYRFGLGPVCARQPSIRVSDEAGNVIETHEHAGDFKEP
jgi:hypothetical protein